MRLYELTREYEAIQALVDLSDGELSPDLATRLNAVVAETTKKLEACAIVLTESEAQVEMFKKEIQRLSDRMQYYVKRAAFLRQYMSDALRVQGVERLDTGRFFLKRQKNPVSVVIHDESLVPREFFGEPKVIPAQVVKARVKEAWAAKTTVPGCHPEQEERLVIQ